MQVFCGIPFKMRALYRKIRELVVGYQSKYGDGEIVIRFIPVKNFALTFLANDRPTAKSSSLNLRDNPGDRPETV